MKIGRKGFMLAEVVVVSVVVVTVLVTLYVGLNNVSSAYEIRNRYYDVDSLYVAMEINDILINDNVVSSISKASEVSDIDSNIKTFSNFYLGNVGDSIYSYITPYDIEDMLSLKSYNNNVTFSEYLDYLSSNLDFDSDYDYMIIVERRENSNVDDCYYYALKLKYSDFVEQV